MDQFSLSLELLQQKYQNVCKKKEELLLFRKENQNIQGEAENEVMSLVMKKQKYEKVSHLLSNKQKIKREVVKKSILKNFVVALFIFGELMLLCIFLAVILPNSFGIISLFLGRISVSLFMGTVIHEYLSVKEEIQYAEQNCADALVQLDVIGKDLEEKKQQLFELREQLHFNEEQIVKVDEVIQYLETAIRVLTDAKEEATRKLLRDPLVENELNEIYQSDSDVLKLMRKIRLEEEGL